MDLKSIFFFPSTCHSSHFRCTGDVPQPDAYAHTQCDTTPILDALIWFGGAERLHHRSLRFWPYHQFSPRGYSPEWHPVSRLLLSPLFARHCKYIHSGGAQRARLSPCNFKPTCCRSDTNYLPLHVATLALPLNCAPSLWSETPAVALFFLLFFIISYLLEWRLGNIRIPIFHFLTVSYT